MIRNLQLKTMNHKNAHVIKLLIKKDTVIAILQIFLFYDFE